MSNKIKENQMEKNIVTLLQEIGWSTNCIGEGLKTVLFYPSEKELRDNFANITYHNNRRDTALGSYRLTDSETNQILEKIICDGNPCNIHDVLSFGKITFKRDNKEDINNYGKDVVLDVLSSGKYGSTVYQIAVQPVFEKKDIENRNRRGDIMLLMNGIPVIHIELKANGVNVTEAVNQIHTYINEGIFSGFFSTIQAFVAISENDVLYFPNPGKGSWKNVMPCRWMNTENKEIRNYMDATRYNLSIPAAHDMIKFYIVSDSNDDTLKIARSYQITAIESICQVVGKHHWDTENTKGGYVFHTTGSGKTLTTFITAMTIVKMGLADKVVILTDRTELGTQTSLSYKGFADDREFIQTTDNTYQLAYKLASDNSDDSIIVTSPQKFNNLDESFSGQKLLDAARKKRIVLIFDEAHRSVFGKMMNSIKENFPRALMFGFTGTPILEENCKLTMTTEHIFGPELCKYTVAEGIRDKNVLGFDTYKIITPKYSQLRQIIALKKAKANSVAELDTDEKREIYSFYMNRNKFPDCGHKDDDGNYIKGLEDELDSSYYDNPLHRAKVAENVYASFLQCSFNKKYHAMLATSSIKEANEYYKLFLEHYPALRVAVVYDNNIDYKGDFNTKEEDLVRAIKTYNKMYDTAFSISGDSYAAYKKDVAARLSHKGKYKYFNETDRLDLVIVVDQMLTGFDSKYVNTLHLDKYLRNEQIVQAFSRTNRIADNDKTYGIIKYYRRPYSEEQAIKAAFDMYASSNVPGLFVNKLYQNLEEMNKVFQNIKSVFEIDKIKDFSKVPESEAGKKMFVSAFNEFANLLRASMPQGFSWGKSEYRFTEEDGLEKPLSITVCFTKTEYDVLTVRYSELCQTSKSGVKNKHQKNIPYNIDYSIVELGSMLIDADTIDVKARMLSDTIDAATKEQFDALYQQFCSSLASLKEVQQKIAMRLANKIRTRTLKLEPNKTFLEYVSEEAEKEKRNELEKIADGLGIDFTKLLDMVNMKLTEDTINERGRYKSLFDAYNRKKAKIYLETINGERYRPYKVHKAANEYLRNVIIDFGKKY